MLDIDMFYTHVWLYHMVECFLIYVVWVHSELIQHLGSGLGNPFSWNSFWKNKLGIQEKRFKSVFFYSYLFPWHDLKFCIQIICNTRKGRGVPNILIYYTEQGEQYEDPKIVLHNEWTAHNVSAGKNSKNCFENIVLADENEVGVKTLWM